MLLDNSSESSSTSTPDGAGSGKPGGAGVIVVVLLLLIVGAVVVWRPGTSRGGNQNAAPNGSPTINDGAGQSPPPTIFAVKPGPPIPAVSKEWAVCANSSFDYWFEYPTAWTLSIPPEYTPQGGARMLLSPTQRTVAIIIIPFGLYGGNGVKDLIERTESAYLGNHEIEGADAKSQINGKDALRRTYKCRVDTAAGFEDSKAIGTIITSSGMGYVVFIRGAETELTAALPTYDRLVSSFHVEKMALRASGAPAPGKSGGPGGTPASSQSGAPAASQSGAPASSQSGAPAASQSGAPAASQSGAPAASQSGAPAASQSGASADSASGAPAAAVSSPGAHK